MTLARFVQANEPQLLAYRVYLNDDRTRMSVVLHINPDSASLARHMKCSLTAPDAAGSGRRRLGPVRVVISVVDGGRCALPVAV
jgi:hypothetical protein